MGKYDAFDNFFRDLEGDRVRVDLEAFERATGVDIPPSARRYEAWWSGSHDHARWVRYGWRASPRLGSNQVVFTRVGAQRASPQSEPASTADSQPARTDIGDLILLGCVATKNKTAMPAKDLYASALWRKRRSYAEASGKPWLILSAEYGLVDPDQVIEPYDKYMGHQNRDYREQWSRVTADGVISWARGLGAHSVEIHAGNAYVEFGLERALRAAGLEVIRPLEGLRQGEQLAWYPTDGRELSLPSTARTVPSSTWRDRELKTITADHIVRIAETYRSGVLGESWDQLPEVWNLPGGSAREQRLWITFVAAVDRARDAARLWAAAHQAWEDDRWVFDPAQIMARPYVKLADILRKHRISQRHTQDSAAWRSIAEAIESKQCPAAISAALDGRSVDAAAVLRAVGTSWPHGTRMFPLLSGPKISVMWVRMLAFPGGALIHRADVIPVAVDTHVQRVTEMLGLVQVRELEDRHRSDIQRVWFEGVSAAGIFGAPEGIDGTAAGIDPALWALGKEGCSRCEQSGRQIPVGPICELCVLGRVGVGP